jgi:hypothetical protein
MKSKRLILIFGVILFLLLIPFIAMQLSIEVNWTITDFFVMAILLTSIGLLIELTLRTVKTKKNRIIISGLLIVLFLIVWAELAVGIFGTPFAGT